MSKRKHKKLAIALAAVIALTGGEQLGYNYLNKRKLNYQYATEIRKEGQLTKDYLGNTVITVPNATSIINDNKLPISASSISDFPDLNLSHCQNLKDIANTMLNYIGINSSTIDTEPYETLLKYLNNQFIIKIDKTNNNNPQIILSEPSFSLNDIQYLPNLNELKEIYTSPSKSLSATLEQTNKYIEKNLLDSLEEINLENLKQPNNPLLEFLDLFATTKEQKLQTSKLLTELNTIIENSYSNQTSSSITNHPKKLVLRPKTNNKL